MKAFLKDFLGLVYVLLVLIVLALLFPEVKP